jgi:hypothetical protein
MSEAYQIVPPPGSPSLHQPAADTSMPGAGTGPETDLLASPMAPRAHARSAGELRPGGGGG